MCEKGCDYCAQVIERGCTLCFVSKYMEFVNKRVDKHGNYPLHRIIALYKHEKHTALFYTLLENGAQISTRNKKGLTPLHIACEKGYIELVKIMALYTKFDSIINENFWVKYPNGYHGGYLLNPPIYSSMEYIYYPDKERDKIVMFLIENGAIINGNLLVKATARWMVSIVRFILKSGLSADAKNDAGQSALDISICPEIVILLLEWGATPIEGKIYDPRVQEIIEKYTPLTKPSL